MITKSCMLISFFILFWIAYYESRIVTIKRHTLISISVCFVSSIVVASLLTIVILTFGEILHMLIYKTILFKIIADIGLLAYNIVTKHTILTPIIVVCIIGSMIVIELLALSNELKRVENDNDNKSDK